MLMTRKSKSGGEDTIDTMMTLAECASYLHLSENTVLKLARNSKLPGVLEDRKWSFRRDLVDEWLQQQLGIEEDELEEIPDGTRIPLEDLLPESAVIGDLRTTSSLAVIEELAACAYSNGWLHDKPWFVGAVVERESLSSTAMEGGVAFLHTRPQAAGKVARPFIIVGRSYNGVDFGAPDGKPTFLFFLLGLKYDKLHLPVLGRLARAMRNPTTIAKLRSLPSVTKMRALLLKADADALSADPDKPTSYETPAPKLDRQMRLRTIMRLNAMRQYQARKAEEEAKKKTTQKKRRRRTSKAGMEEAVAAVGQGAGDEQEL
jgi:excisionase family DNA binding protein